MTYTREWFGFAGPPGYCFFAMDPAAFHSLPIAISTPRLAPYVRATTTQGEALRLYTWNIEAAAAMWGPIQVLEISLRNIIHAQLVLKFDIPDWWNHPMVSLTKFGRDRIAKADKDAQSTANLHRRSVVPDDIVAALPFVFWESLLTKGGKQQYETKFWQPFLHNAFPHFTGQRKDVQQRVETLRHLRNRIAHHEPIFHRHLQADHETLLHILGWIDPTVAQYVDAHSRLKEVLAKRERCVKLGHGTRF